MQLFYHPHILDNLVLDEVESHHCIKVLRHKTGDSIQIIDGKGQLVSGTITNAHPKKCEISNVASLHKEEKPPQVHIAIAPTKNFDRMEWFVEKATEIGVTEITFIKCDRSERAKINMNRINKKVLSALKQCQSLWLPRVNDLTDLNEVVDMSSEEQKLIAHLEEGEKHILTPSGQSSIVLIGPEGDFTPEEIAMATERDFRSVSLGKNVLRTETAGIVAASLLVSNG